MEDINTNYKSNKFRTIALWTIAVIITILSAYFQRITGPTYPLSGSDLFQGKDVFYKFPRSCNLNEPCEVKVQVTDESLKGVLLWKRYKTNDEYSFVNMENKDGHLIGFLPEQNIMAAKLEYKVRVIGNNTETTLPPVVIRFKGEVPAPVLFIHIILIFTAMLVSTRAGLEFFVKDGKLKKFTFWALGLMTVGGMILGPIVQKYAFGEYWTGIPFGIDLTDNKTLIAWIAWIVATVMIFKSKKPGYWVLGAALVTLIVFLIPHSVLGSEFDYSKMK